MSMKRLRIPASLALSLGHLVDCSCVGQISIGGASSSAYVSGSGGNVYGDRLTLRHDSGFSITTSCADSWDPNGFMQFQLLGQTLSFTADLSQVGCACNLAFYLIQEPGRGFGGAAGEGTCPSSPYYCDAANICGQLCPEIDIMEANSHVFASTNHRCDEPRMGGPYETCDKSGCAQNTRDMGANLYGPGGQIDTAQPFDVHTTFHSDDGNSLTGMTTKLTQGFGEVTLDHSTCSSDYFRSLGSPLASGMSLRITYWGSSASTMSWLDQPPCGSQSCNAETSGEAIISNIRVSGGSIDGSVFWIAVVVIAGIGVGAWVIMSNQDGPCGKLNCPESCPIGSLPAMCRSMGMDSPLTMIKGFEAGDRVVVKDTFALRGDTWGGCGSSTVRAGTQGVVTKIETDGTTSVNFTGFHFGTSNIPGRLASNLQLMSNEPVRGEQRSDFHGISSMFTRERVYAVAGGAACICLVVLLCTLSQGQNTARYNGNGGSATSCCSWDGGNTCGDTTEYCRSARSPCESHCKGQWIA